MAQDDSRADGFDNVDASSNPGAFVRWLEYSTGMAYFKAVKPWTYQALELPAGASVLDVGCGLGQDVQALARLVGPGGRAVGVDSSVTMIAEARQRAEGSGLPVEFVAGQAERLEFPDGSFDGCRAERVLQHVEQPGHVVAEMARVLRPGGRMVVLEPDWEMLFIDSPDQMVTRAVVKWSCDSHKSGWIGRQLRRLLLDAGLTDVSVACPVATLTDIVEAELVLGLGATVREMQVAGVIAASDGERWLQQLADADRAGRFCCGLTGFLVHGRKG
jgi:ubiquinone/menaquinone biosynthesis C-methylase UbiE